MRSQSPPVRLAPANRRTDTGVTEATRAGRPGALRADGGMTANELLMQLEADVLGAPVIAPRVAEITATGAAYAAGLATGFWAGLDELAANYAIARRWEPQPRRVGGRDLGRGGTSWPQTPRPPAAGSRRRCRRARPRARGLERRGRADAGAGPRGAVGERCRPFRACRDLTTRRSEPHP